MCTQFSRLCEIRWPEVSSAARKVNGVEFLPLTEDVVRLNNNITEKGTTLASDLAKNGHDADMLSQD